MISRTVEYALRATVWLASRMESPQTTRQIAAATQVPPNYLAKVLQTLVDRGIITSRRGLGGGFVLARHPKQLTVLDVVNAVEPIPRIHSCPLRLASHAAQLCPLHRRLDDAMASVEKAFAESRIAELVDDRAGPAPLCPDPVEGPWHASFGNLATPAAKISAPRKAPRRKKSR